jgi:hypothetical protein
VATSSIVYQFFHTPFDCHRRTKPASVSVSSHFNSKLEQKTNTHTHTHKKQQRYILVALSSMSISNPAPPVYKPSTVLTSAPAHNLAVSTKDLVHAVRADERRDLLNQAKLKAASRCICVSVSVSASASMCPYVSQSSSMSLCFSRLCVCLCVSFSVYLSLCLCVCLCMCFKCASICVVSMHYNVIADCVNAMYFMWHDNHHP